MMIFLSGIDQRNRSRVRAGRGPLSRERLHRERLHRVAALTAALCACLAWGRGGVALAASVPQKKKKPTVIVNKGDNTLKLFVPGQPVRKYRVATGLYKCTPEGTFKVIQKSLVSKSGRHPLGTHWIGLNTLGKRGWYRIGIHGTNEPKSIGKWASKACVRMLNSDVKQVYRLVPMGSEVRIVNIPPPKLSRNPEKATPLFYEMKRAI